jgi:hypothetical protein
MDGFRKGYGKDIKAQPVAKAAPAASPFAALSKQDAKEILFAVLNGRELDSYQRSKLQGIYNKL